MSTQTVLLIILAAILALGLSFFQYFFRGKKAKMNILLAILRFCSWFATFLLLINPKITKEDYFIEKSNLVLLFDNSESIENLQGSTDAKGILRSFANSQALKERFSIRTHYFSDGLLNDDSINFGGSVTNLSKALRDLGEVYGISNNTYVLVTDGNQNSGSDFEFENLGTKTTVFPIVVGDTTKYEDLYISQVNVNRYTFLDNQFPFEANISYSGNQLVETELNVYLEGRRIFKEDILLSRKNNSTTISGLLKANSVGLKNLKFLVSPINSEKNVENNEKEVAIEVIDEQTKIALISSISHPDLGTLKKSIEQNQQRSVTLLKPGVPVAELDVYDFFLLYQPNRQYREVFDFLRRKGVGSFVITGADTDWSFLNSVQTNFQKESFNQIDDVIPIKNEAFGLFDLTGLEIGDFPPLKTQLGDITINTSAQALFTQQIRGVNLDSPLLFTYEFAKTRNAVLLGENIWQWRIQSYRENRNFDEFDNLIGQLMRYLADTKTRSRLELTYDPIFNAPSRAKVRAAFFDETYNFQPETNLVLTVRTKGESDTMEIPMILKSNSFEADLSSLEAGDYEFTVQVKNENISRSGRFKILDFDLENQLTSANTNKLRRLAERNNGQLFFPSQMNSLVEELLENSRFTPVQRSIKNVVSLIDFSWLLIALTVSLSLEWFIRKYNGLL